jgi:hypothetical protein
MCARADACGDGRPGTVQVLLGKELTAAVHRALPPPVVVPAQRTSAAGAVVSLLTLWLSLITAVFIGGSWGGGRAAGTAGATRRPGTDRRLRAAGAKADTATAGSDRAAGSACAPT